ncbi:MAG: hypothetical protein Q7R87_00910 [Nanoarchaeota archaeon]|nr:hypothetical protein [Nanoarchaeota archaeon]
MANILDRIDDAVLAGVNSGVHAWNWTTGKTKIDLVNNLMSVGAVTQNLSFANMAYDSPVTLPVALAVSAYSIINTHRKQREHSNIAELEERTISDRLFHPVVEQYKADCAQNGYKAGIGGTVITSIPLCRPDPSNNIDLSYSLFGAGELLQGLAHQAMRADYLPPRKNCVKRGVDNVSDMVKQIRVAIPRPAFT